MIKQSIIEKLSKAFAPTFLEVADQSAAHVGHFEAPTGGETHFKVTLVTPLFEGLSPLEKHQWVHRVLAAELKQIHALSLDLKSKDA